jgi:hypothetical protein
LGAEALLARIAPTSTARELKPGVALPEFVRATIIFVKYIKSFKKPYIC